MPLSSELETTRARRLCAVLWTSGCVLAAGLIVTHGGRGLVLGFGVLILAAMAADRADPTKWSA